MYGVGTHKKDVVMLHVDVTVSKDMIEDIETCEQNISECCGIGLMSLISWSKPSDNWKIGQQVKFSVPIEKGNEEAFTHPVMEMLKELNANPRNERILPITDEEWGEVAYCFAPDMENTWV